MSEIMFEVATRQKLRFDSPRGLLSVEDLWELPLTSTTGKINLNSIALDLHSQLRGASEVVSFVDDTATADPTIKLRFDIVKHIIDTKKKENTEASAARAKAELKQQILAALDKRRANNLDAMSEEELLQRLNAL